jgi:hypothetical protein
MLVAIMRQLREFASNGEINLADVGFLVVAGSANADKFAAHSTSQGVGKRL